MRSFLLFGLFFFGVFALANAYSPAAMTEFYKICGVEMGYSPETVKTMFKHFDPQFGCVTVCVLKKINDWDNQLQAINKEHVLKMVKVEKAYMKDDKLLGAVERCVDVGNEQKNECEKGLEYVKCIFTYFKERRQQHQATTHAPTLLTTTYQ